MAARLKSAAEVAFDVAVIASIIAVPVFFWTLSMVAIQAFATALFAAVVLGVVLYQWDHARPSRRTGPEFRAPRAVRRDEIREPVSETDLAEDAWEREEAREAIRADTGLVVSADDEVG